MTHEHIARDYNHLPAVGPDVRFYAEPYWNRYAETIPTRSALIFKPADTGQTVRQHRLNWSLWNETVALCI